MREYWWFSSLSMTVVVIVYANGVSHIVDTAPVTKKFIGQPLENLERWMSSQGGFRKSLMMLEFV